MKKVFNGVKNMHVTRLAGVSAAVLLALSTTSVRAEYPDKSIELVVPWSAGGVTDSRARILAPKFSEILGTSVVVRNLAGAAGTVGTAEVARSKPDGHVLLITTSGPTVIQPQLRNLPYKLNDFEPVCRLDSAPYMVMTPPDSKYNSMDDLIQAAKSSDKQLSYSTVGVGSMPHLFGLALEQSYDISLKHLPAKAGADAAKNLLGGFVDFMPDQVDAMSRFGLKGLASATNTRLPDHPNIPTLKELGINIAMSNWQAIYAPKGTPESTIEKLASACQTVFEDEGVVNKFVNLSARINVLVGDDLTRFVQFEERMAGDLLRQSGMVNN